MEWLWRTLKSFFQVVMRHKEKKSASKKGLRFEMSWLIVVIAVVMCFTDGFIYFISYFCAIILHELSHAEVARRLGYVLNKLKLMPYGAALIGEFEGAGFRDEIKIAVAGPLCNMVMSILLVALLWLAPATYYFTYEFILCNIYLAIFNILPVYPLDGGRVLLSVFSSKYPRYVAYKKVRIIGFIIGGVFASLFVVSFFYGFNLSFIVISVFILSSTVIPDHTATYQRLYHVAYRSGKIKKGIAIRYVMISENATTSELFKRINSNYFTCFIVVDDKLNRKKEIKETDLEKISTDKLVLRLKDII